MLLVNWWGARETLVGVGVGGGEVETCYKLKDRLKHARMECECLVRQNTARPKDRLKHPVQPHWFPSASSGTQKRQRIRLHKVEGVDLAKKI